MKIAAHVVLIFSFPARRVLTIAAVSGIFALLLSASIMSVAYANHTKRTEYEAHGANSGAGGLRANIKVQSPSVTGCLNISFPCTHTMVYEYQFGEGFIGAGWLKYKGATGVAQIRGFVHWKDFVTGGSIYYLGETLTSGTTFLFQARKQNTLSSSSCWYGITPANTYSKCFSDFQWGDPRLVGRLNNLQTSYGTTIGTFTSVQNRAISTNNWVDMGQDAFSTKCISSSGTLMHRHSTSLGLYTAHISPPSQSGETSSGSCGGGTPDDLGG